ncbi:MAG: rhodanese-like domain-containing protein [Bacteroidota bacterium]|nr:rhodanese-like domain-containing protein [Bacteroidota bacterium]
MKTIKNNFAKLSFILTCIFSVSGFSQTQLAFAPAKVDFDAYEKLVSEVKEHRKARLVNLQTFQKMAKEEKVIVLDTRSDAMYASKHVKGAIHLNFADFTQSNLAKIIPSADYKILIYCNNNFDKDEINFASKAYIPKFTNNEQKALTLALNIPTYINLYGYGYKNVYELNELISVYSNMVEFEGTSVYKKAGKGSN